MTLLQRIGLSIIFSFILYLILSVKEHKTIKPMKKTTLKKLEKESDLESRLEAIEQRLGEIEDTAFEALHLAERLDEWRHDG